MSKTRDERALEQFLMAADGAIIHSREHTWQELLCQIEVARIRYYDTAVRERRAPMRATYVERRACETIITLGHINRNDAELAPPVIAALKRYRRIGYETLRMETEIETLMASYCVRHIGMAQTRRVLVRLRARWKTEMIHNENVQADLDVQIARLDEKPGGTTPG
jgi:hypothetical protein